MLREIETAQPPGEPRRRWFADEYFDLIVWLADPDQVVAFQLCYDRPGEERAVTWDRDAGYRHCRVDGGEETPVRNRSPVLSPGGSFAREAVTARFAVASAGLDPAVRSAVLGRLRDCPAGADPPVRPPEG